MLISQLVDYLETVAPLALQENYDNCGLQVGDQNCNITGVLVCLDCTEAIVDEAILNSSNLIIAHHPLIFTGLKQITGKNAVERCLIKAIKHHICIYAMHTNLDNLLGGVNAKIAEKLLLTNCKILRPKQAILKKLVTFCPNEFADQIKNALFMAGAGNIGQYDLCSFSSQGIGSFRGDVTSQPFVGEPLVEHREPETRIEVVFPSWAQDGLIKALLAAHPYEEVAYDIYAIEANHQNIGAGIIGKLETALPERFFLEMVKQQMNTACVRHTQLLGKPITTVAVCGGSGSFLIGDAIKAGADVFITADIKYHQFFEADGRILIADIGHFESEQFTIDLIVDLIRNKFANFAPLPYELEVSKTNSNPVKYL